MDDGTLMVLLGLFLIVIGLVVIARREHYAQQPPIYGSVGPVEKSRWWPAPIILAAVIFLVPAVLLLKRGGGRWPFSIIFIVGPLVGWGYSMKTGKRFMGYGYGRPRVQGMVGGLVALMGLTFIVLALSN